MTMSVPIARLCSPLCELILTSFSNVVTRWSLLSAELTAYQLINPQWKEGLLFPGSSNQSASHYTDLNQMLIPEAINKGCLARKSTGHVPTLNLLLNLSSGIAGKESLAPQRKIQM